MASPKRKPPAKLKLTPTSTRGAQHDDSDDSDDSPAAAATDEALAEFLGAPPTAADSMHVVASNPSGDAVVQVRQRKEVLADPDGIADHISAACERWAQSERRLVRFRASWHRGERVVATHAFEHGTASTDQPILDGSAQSFLVQQQHAQLARDKLFIESQEMTYDSWKQLLAIANKRNEALEKENDLLRERLRKADDVGNEIAIESARAEIEQRGRTADLIEKRVLPIVQAIAVQKLQESAAALTGLTGENNAGQQKEPSTKP